MELLQILVILLLGQQNPLVLLLREEAEGQNLQKQAQAEDQQALLGQKAFLGLTAKQSHSALRFRWNTRSARTMHKIPIIAQNRTRVRPHHRGKVNKLAL